MKKRKVKQAGDVKVWRCCMELKSVKSMLGKAVYYDSRQMDFDGDSKKEYILTACILRKDKHDKLYYQAELKDIGCKNSVLIVDLDKVEIKKNTI